MKSEAFPETVVGGRGKRLMLLLTPEDALRMYQAIHFVTNSGRDEKLRRLFEDVYEDATGERLLEPWEWEDD